MKKITIKTGILNTAETNFNEVIHSILMSNGYPMVNSCCSHSTPTNGQTLSWNSTTNKLEFVSGGSSGVSNLGIGTRTSTILPITNSNGTGINLPLVTNTLAGLASPAMFNAFNTAISPDGNTYITNTNGQIEFFINGVSEMILTPGKMTTDSIIDPPVYAGTPITTAQRNAYGNVAGYLIYNSDTTQYEFNNGVQWKTVGGSSITTNITEGTNLYFTEPRVLSTKLTGFNPLLTPSAITATDTVLSGINKLNSIINSNDLTTLHTTGNEIITGIKDFSTQPTGIQASSISFDNTGTTMTATNVQEALIEINANLLQLINTFNQPI